MSAGGANPSSATMARGFDLGLRAPYGRRACGPTARYHGPLTDAVLRPSSVNRASRYPLPHEPPFRLQIAALAPIVTRHAEQGDPVALQISMRRPRAISLAAGVLESWGSTAETVICRRRGRGTAYQEAPPATPGSLFAGPVDICRPKCPPAVGAAFWSEIPGVEWSEDLIGTLDSDLAASGSRGS